MKTQDGIVKLDDQQEPMVLSKATMDRLLRLNKPSNAIALYTFYYYTAKWQKTTRAKASTSYCAKGLGIGEAAIRKAKAELIELGLIAEHKATDEFGRVVGWYVDVKFVWFSKPHSQNCQCGEEIHPCKKPQCGEMNPNALNTNSLNALNTNTVVNAPAESIESCNNKPSSPPKKKKGFRAPKQDEVAIWAEKWAKEKGYTPSVVMEIAEKAWQTYSDNDWKDSRGTKVKCWKSKIRNNWLTRDKVADATNKQGQPSPGSWNY